MGESLEIQWSGRYAKWWVSQGNQRGCRWEKASRGALVWLEEGSLKSFLKRLI